MDKPDSSGAAMGRFQDALAAIGRQALGITEPADAEPYGLDARLGPLP